MIAPGTRVGKYEITRLLGQGGFGMVYVARDTKLDRDCALKFLQPEHTTRLEILQRFLAEARSAAKIKHGGIVTVFECDVVAGAGPGLDGMAYIAMELLEGQSLHDRLARGRLPIAHAVEIARQVASALAAAHAEHIVHRDLKPDNIFLVPDAATVLGERVKVLDFGIAKLVDDTGGTAAKTSTHMIFGTPRYMSPEQCKSTAKVDERSDVYALGCILFEMIAGKPPFEGDAGELIAMHQLAPAPSTRAARPELPAELEATIAAMLAKAPAERPQTMRDVIARLAKLSPAALAAADAAAAVAPTVPPTVPPERSPVLAPVPPTVPPTEPPERSPVFTPVPPTEPVVRAEPAPPPKPTPKAEPAPKREPAPRPEVRVTPGPRPEERRSWLPVAALAGLVGAGAVAVALTSSGGRVHSDAGIPDVSVVVAPPDTPVDTPVAAERERIGVVFAIDSSLSMAGERFVRAKRFALEVMHRLDDLDRVGVVTFGKDASIVVAPQVLTDRATVVRGFDQIPVAGTSSVRAGLETASAMAAKLSARVRHVILLSDDPGERGAATVWPSGVSLTAVSLSPGAYLDLADLTRGRNGRIYSVNTDQAAVAGAAREAQRVIADAGGTAPEEVRAPVAEDLAAYAANIPGSGPLVARIETTLGAIECELLGDAAPLAVASFVGLATGQHAWRDPRTADLRRGPYFDGLTFHRVVPDFMIQGGDPLGTGRGGPGYTFVDEVSAGLKMTRGALVMANGGANTNGSQFFILDGDAPWLEGKYTIFGRCTNAATVSAIARVERDGERPRTPVEMKVTIRRR